MTHHKAVGSAEVRELLLLGVPRHLSCQGTHFFQNLTSFGVGYFTINSYMNDGVYNQDILNAQPAVEETQFIRHVRFDTPLIVKMDGKKKQGVVMLPE